MSAKWIPPLLISSFSWGTSDTICDIVIEGDHAKELPTTKSDMELTSVSTIDDDADEKHHKVDKTKKKAPSAKLGTEEVTLSMEVDADDKYNKEKAKRHLTRHSTSSYQTVFIAVVIDYIALFIYFLGLYIFYDQYRAYVGKSSFIFKEHYDAPFYMALASGAFSYLAFHFMMRAWETSSSTIILPLLQFPSIFVFFACGIPKMWFGETWIESYWHILAYVILFFGGLLPATEGDPRRCFTKEFWSQPVVKMAIGSEMCHGIYNILISSGEHSMSHDDPNVHWFVKHFEFFAVTRIAYIIACCVFLCFDKKYREEVVALKHVAKRPLYGAYGANSLGFVGYIASSRAYQLHSQTGVVTAAESALNQMLNLFSAYILKKFFRLGKDESLKGMKVKVISAFIIAFGLYMGS